MRAGRHRQAQLQVVIDVLKVFAARRRLNREQLDALPVQQHFQFVRLRQALDVFVAVAGQADLDLVLAVLREGVTNERAAAGADGQPVGVHGAAQELHRGCRVPLALAGNRCLVTQPVHRVGADADDSPVVRGIDLGDLGPHGHVLLDDTVVRVATEGEPVVRGD